MDVDKYLKTITNLNEYISFTVDVHNKRISLNVPLNISTILSLKNLRSIEIEYFNKCEENGGATKIVELLLHTPPSKTWSLLGGELINILQYWLEALRKHLILHNIHWWTFLKLNLKFIKVLHSKHKSLNKILIEETAECLLDLATHSVPDATQRNEIIKIFNAISAEASRNIRFAYKDKLQKYFIKLSMLLISTGDLPLQYRMLETLLRWLLPRHDPAVRKAAADKWFPEGLYSRLAVCIFLERPWQNFMKDARDFLNAQNVSGDLVTSVICKTFSVGKHICFSINEQCWLDFNTSTKCISVLMEPRLSDALGGDHDNDAILIHEDNVSNIELKQVHQQVLITMRVLELSRVYPFSCHVIADVTTSNDIHISISTRSDICRLDKFLRGIFREKYQVLMDVENKIMCMSPDDQLPNTDVINATEEDTRFSMPPDVPRRKHSGYVLKHRNPRSWNSPSTISTSSLAQLHEKLAALPRYTFDKEPVSVCALPQLSTVSEVSEIEEHTNNSSLSTIKNRLNGFGQCHKSVSRSISNNTTEETKHSSAQIDDETSCLLLATIGSADDSITSDTINRLPKNVSCNIGNIVDLLAQEAFQINTNSCTNTECKNKTTNLQQKDHFQKETSLYGKKNIKQCFQDKVLHNEQQPVDESSNEVVENTPFSSVQVKRTKYKNNNQTALLVFNEETDNVKLTHDYEIVENFFSQHVNENKNGNLVISPSLARKINETSSECSEDIEQCIYKAENTDKCMVQENQLTSTDIIECVNTMVDIVCQDLKECTKHIDLVNETKNVDKITCAKCTLQKAASNITTKKHVISDSQNSIHHSVSKPKKKPTSKIKLKSTLRKSKLFKETSKNTVNKPPFTIMSPLIERPSITDDVSLKVTEGVVESPKSSTTALFRRKRKLYSPKDEYCENNIASRENNAECSKTSNVIVTSYKELEQETKKRIRRPRNRLSLKKPLLTDSPRTIKRNQIFDSLKSTTNGEPVKFADKLQFNNEMAIYNYTSDSEDEDEKKKSNSVLKKSASPVVDSDKTIITRKLSKQANKAMKTLDITEKKTKHAPKSSRNLRTKRTTAKHQKGILCKNSDSPKINLEDERMRSAGLDILNTSLVMDGVQNPDESPKKQPELVISDVPLMECIVEDKLEDKNITEYHQKSKSKRMLSLKRNKDKPKINVDISIINNEGTISPLPGLVVETVLTTEPDINDTLSTNMLQKFKDIYHGNPVMDSEVNTTQNLLSDANEPINYSSSHLNITEELNRDNVKKYDESHERGGKKTKVPKNKVLKVKKGKKVERKSQKVKSGARDETEIKEISDTGNTEKSLATLGNSHSPITAHGDFDEHPPNSTLLNANIEPRLVEQEYLNQSLKDFFNKLTAQLHESNREGDVYTECDFKEGNQAIDDSSSIKNGNVKSPVVIISRLSPEYISQVSVKSSSIGSSGKSSKENFLSQYNDCNNIREPDKTHTQNTTTKTTMAKISTISPIKLNDDLKLIQGNTSKSQHSESEDDCLKRVKSIFSNLKQDKLQPNWTAIEISNQVCSRVVKNIATFNSLSGECLLEKFTSDSVSSRAVVSSKVSKRKHSPIISVSKRCKRDEVNNNLGSTITGSGPSLSSVNEWFQRDDRRTQTADNINMCNIEINQNILEKLDTTLTEIHHNSSKRFINLFVEATTNLNDLKQNMEQLQRHTASEVLSSVVSALDAKFLEQNNRFQSMADQFIETFKKKVHDLMREECQQKRVMVTLLREDVKAVIDHLKGKVQGSALHPGCTKP